MSPLENVIIGNSFEEVLFATRNKEYGAYYIRKHQKKYLIVGFFISFLFITASVVTPMIMNHFQEHKPFHNVAGPTVLNMDSTLQVELPKPPELRVEQNIARFTVPEVVDTVRNEDLTLNIVDEQLENAGENVLPPDLIGYVPPQNDDVIDPVETVFTIVEVPAQFNHGDLNEFNNWVLKNVKYPQLAVENGISEKIYMQFVVNAKGDVENVKVVRGNDPSLMQEAIRVIQSSPKWSPPLQGGRPVKQQFTIPVNFKLQQ